MRRSPVECGGLGLGLEGQNQCSAAAIFLGGLGAHHFYLGNTGRGIIYLVFSWTFIPLLVGLIEGIIYLTKSEDEFQRQYA
ncbi:TM2 domain-containing protein [Halobaculum halobium]|uniref:TM2 domain-containing protein n=1 Tax=Halobaculum halobium TaxID=3032281 RepID=UPI00362388DB